VAITFVAVCFAWVFFRAVDMPTALGIVKGMLGMNGVELPDAVGQRLGAIMPLLERWGVGFYLGGGTRFAESWIWIIAGGLIAFGLPNTQEITRKFRPALSVDARPTHVDGVLSRFLTWMPSRAWAVVIGLVAIASLLSLSRPSEFLYFQF
jgi:hypothetical protein